MPTWAISAGSCTTSGRTTSTSVRVGHVVAAPQTTALILDNDGHDRCGKELGEYTERQMSAVRGRVELGHFHQG